MLAARPLLPKVSAVEVQSLWWWREWNFHETNSTNAHQTAGGNTHPDRPATDIYAHRYLDRIPDQNVYRDIHSDRDTINVHRNAYFANVDFDSNPNTHKNIDTNRRYSNVEWRMFQSEHQCA